MILKLFKVAKDKHKEHFEYYGNNKWVSVFSLNFDVIKPDFILNYEGKIKNEE
jgi:hypothetical protein